MRAAFVAGFLVVGLLVPAEVAQAQAKVTTGRGTPEWMVNVHYLAELYGVAFCRPEGSFFLVMGGLSAIDEAATKAHEKKHIEQHGRFRNCEMFYGWYGTPLGKLEVEAEALAAGWCVQVKMGADALSTKQSALLLLIRYYVPGTQIYEAAQVFAKYAKECPK
jgi:hypothetical protein